MANRKLTSCIGYSLRLAKRQNNTAAARHLWQGLYSLTHDDGEGPRTPLCLFSALGLEETCGVEKRESTESSPMCHGTLHAPGQSAKLARTDLRTNVDADAAAGQDCISATSRTKFDCTETSTQTETDMISRPDFELIMGNIMEQMDSLRLQLTILGPQTGEDPDPSSCKLDTQPSSSNVDDCDVIPAASVQSVPTTLEELRAQRHAQRRSEMRARIAAREENLS